MKTKIATHLFAALLGVLALASCTGCQTHLGQAMDKILPEGRADKVTYERGGMVSNTTITATDFVKTPVKVTATKITYDHNNIYVPKIHIEIEGYERVREGE